MRLLPPDPFARLAYVWLIYLVFLVRQDRQDAASIALTIACVAVFLPLYFWAQWLEGPRAVMPIAGITALGLLLFPANQGASVFFVYAATFAARVGGMRIAAAIVGALVLVIMVEAWRFSLPLYAWGWPAGITVLLGGVITYATEARRELRQAQEHAQNMAVVAERERIGRDLHDLLGHSLSVIALKAELASKLADRDPARSLAEIREVERISREALSEVRQAVQASRATVLAVELRVARSALEAAGIELVTEMSMVPMDPASEQALALALREAVTNVIRHSKARRCELRLGTTGDFVRLEVVDNGIGGEAVEGSGLSGMRARVTLLGGRLDRVGERGTRLTITLPRVAAPAVLATAEIPA